MKGMTMSEDIAERVRKAVTGQPPKCPKCRHPHPLDNCAEPGGAASRRRRGSSRAWSSPTGERCGCPVIYDEGVLAFYDDFDAEE
jgi:hypothetical protein